MTGTYKKEPNRNSRTEKNTITETKNSVDRFNNKREDHI